MRKSFGLSTALIFALITLVMYFPSLSGKVPFPRDLVLQFPAWHDAERSEAWQQYADIGDLVTFFYPSRLFVTRATHAGTLPLWNPLFLSGAPFLASPQSALFYLPNSSYYVFSAPTAWTLSLMIRMLLAGIFMTLFVQSLGGSRHGSILSGIVFSLCGFMAAWQGQPMDDAAAWLPLVCYVVLRLQSSPSNRAIALAAVAFSMPVLAGHPETAAHVTLVGIAIALYTWICSQFERQFLVRFAIAGFLAIVLSSVQIVPTLEWLGQLPSPLDVRWPSLTAHDALAWVSRDIIRAPNSAGLWMPESAGYVGMMTLLVAPLGLFHRNRRYALFLAAVTVGAIGAAYGIQPIKWSIDHTPVLSGLKNGRMIFVAGFGLAALAGLGISAVEERIPIESKRRILALILVSLAFVLTFILIRQLQLATNFRVEFTRRPSFSRALLLVSFVPVVWRLCGGLRGRLFPLAASAIVAFDLMTLGYSYTGFAKPGEIFPSAPVFDFLRKQGNSGDFRMVTVGVPFASNASIPYGISSADGYEVRLAQSQLAFCRDYIDTSFSGLYFLPSHFLKFTDRRLDMLNVRYLAATTGSPEFADLKNSQRFTLAFDDGHVALFENMSVLPRAFAVPANGVEVLSGQDEQLERMRSSTFDPQQTVFVSTPGPALTQPVEFPQLPGQAFSSNVQLMENGINHLLLRTSTSSPAVLVISQTHYPGWQATVDGKPTDVFPADLALTGIALPAGAHEVRLSFRPRSIMIGAALTILAGVILIVLAITQSIKSGPAISDARQIRKITRSEPFN